MTLLEFKEKLNLSDIPDSWNEIYEDAVNQVEKSGLDFFIQSLRFSIQWL